MFKRKLITVVDEFKSSRISQLIRRGEVTSPEIEVNHYVDRETRPYR